MRKLPKFWEKPASPWAVLLSPLSLIWQTQTRKRIAKPGFQSDIPVICVGNINMGGVGKTPTVIALVQMLEAAGKTPFVITRGYGGKADETMRVMDFHDAELVGDEAILTAMFAPVIVAKDRGEGARLAQSEGADVIILDDGFQNPSLEKDLSIVVLDSDYGLGNGRIFPAGPLRETLDDAKARADVFLLIGSGKKRAELVSQLEGKCVLEAKLKPIEMGLNWKTGKFFAFAGIGRPEKFFETLRGLGANLVATREFGDHEVVPLKLLQRMSLEAKAMGAQLITTEKDAVRLPSAFQGDLLSLPVRLDVHVGSLESEILQRLNFS